MEERTPHRKVRTGVVVSDKMDKTVVVRIDRMSKHSLYGKPVLRMKKYKAHDENNECRVGDLVQIEETRPLSRHKCWRVAEILERAPILGAPHPLRGGINRDPAAYGAQRGGQLRSEEGPLHAGSRGQLPEGGIGGRRDRRGGQGSHPQQQHQQG